jgi:HK97 family phage prohead protease
MANSFKDLNPENKLQRGIRNAVRNIGMPGEPIRFVLSTERVARDGHVIAASAWDLTNFRRNNPCLWAHDDTALPIGRWENLAVENMPAGDPALFGDLHFASQEYEFAATVEKLYHSGALNAVSVRWSPRAYEPLNDGQGGLRFTDVDLLEVSAVPVPADPDALMVAAQRGIVTNDELVRFETKLGVPGVTILGSETIMEEQVMEEVADEQDAERAGGIKANIPLAKEQPSAEDAGDPIEPVTDDQPTDCTVGDDGECIDTNDCPNGDCAASGDEVLVEPTVAASGVDVPALGGEDPVIEEGRAFDDFDEFERIGKKFSKKNADQIRQAIDALGFAQDALREMLEEEESPMAKATPEANERDVEEEDILGDAEREANAEDAARSIEARNAEEADKLEYINAIEEDLARILGGEKEPDVALETGAIGDLITQVRNML